MCDMYGRIFRSLPCLACVIDCSSIIIDVNSKFESAFAMSKCKLVSSDVQLLFLRGADRLSLSTALVEFKEDEQLFDVEMITGSGDIVRVKWSLSKMSEDSMFLMCGNIAGSSDFSPSKTTTSSPQFESMVNEVLAKERITKLALLAAEKDRFMRIMFHEIRTPLHNLSNTFNGTVKMMKLPSCVADEMTYQIDACTGLVEDLSFSTMFESDQVLHPRPVRMNLRKELESILHHVSIYHSMELSRVEVDIVRNIDFSIPEWISVDQALLRALHNLIKNAVKYCAPNGTVSVDMTYAENAGSDDGPVLTSPKGSQLRNGSLSVSIKNTVSEAMDLVLVNKMFQSCYTPASIFMEKMTMESVGSTKTLSSDSGSDASSRGSSRAPSVTESLVSSEGLGLGLYVAYNIISNLGGLLECSGSESESVFSFSVGVLGAKTSREALRLGSRDGPLSLNSGVNDVALLLKSSSLSKKNWFHAIDSGEGRRHVNTQSLSPSRKKGTPLLDLAGKTRPRVLIVDDSPICRKVLVKALESNGYDTDTACDGKEAVDKLERPPCLYDAVLMDLRMPIMDGITATRVCKAQAHVRELPIIIVTAELGEEVRRECMEAGASHFISKPARVEMLLDLLRSSSATKT